MGYFLGIDLGASRTVAAVAWAADDRAETVDLGDGQGEGVASVLHLGADGMLDVGAEARQWALTEPDRVVEGFPGRIGDGDPMLLAGEPWAPEELTAWLVRWVVDRVAEREGSAAEAVAVARPASWDDARTALLTAAVAEQDLAVSLIAPEAPEPTDAPDDAADPQVGAACAVAVALRDAAGGQPTATTASGRHAAVGGAIAALAAVPAAEESESRDDDGPAVEDPADDGVVDDGPLSESLFDEAPARPDVENGHGADPDGDAEQDHGPADAGGSAPVTGSWDMPAPRVHASGAYEPAGGDRERGDPETGGTGGGGDPATTNLVAELLGFTGGMGATNTAGLLSGYTPPQGMPAAWSGGPVAIAPAETETRTGTATGRAVALPRQRASSGRWSAVAPAPGDLRAPAPALRARNNPTVLVGAGGLVAAVAVVGTLFLWPAPRVTNSATSRPIPAAPVATAPAEPTAAATVVLTPEPTPVPRARPATPRTRRPAVPPVTVPESVSATASPVASGEPTEPTSTLPPSTDVTAPPTTGSDDD